MLAPTLAVGCIVTDDDDDDGALSLAAIDPDATYRIVGVGSGKCVAIDGGSTGQRAGAEIESCSGSAAQQFRIQPVSGVAGFFTIRNVNSDLCLDVENVAANNGARIIQWRCGSGDNQRWSITDVEAGRVRVTARHSGKGLDVAGRGTADGTGLQQWTYSGQDNQQFRIEPVTGVPDAGVPDAGMADAGMPTPGTCGVTASRVRVTEIDLGAAVVTTDDAGHAPLSISPIPSGGSRLAWMGADRRVHVTQLSSIDQATGASFSLPAHDLQDVYADSSGGVLLITRDAEGGGTLNCGQPTNLCGTPPAPPVPCFDAYLVRFDGTRETWATKLTTSSAVLPPYSTGPSGPNVFMIWWYQHHGRIVSDGANYGTYFGAAISVSQGGCINIHQGDRAVVVNPSGTVVNGGFDWGCSHSGYQRLAWNGSRFTYVCKNDAATSGRSGKIAFAPSMAPILPVDLWYSDLGDLVTATGGGYWLAASDARPGQPANAAGFSDVRLLHLDTGAADQNLLLASEPALNVRGPHLAAYGQTRMLAAWETTPRPGDLVRHDAGRRMYVQALSRATGAAEGAPFSVGVTGNPYQELVAFPDGSVAYVAPGSSSTKVKILRILPCP